MKELNFNLIEEPSIIKEEIKDAISKGEYFKTQLDEGLRQVLEEGRKHEIDNKEFKSKRFSWLSSNEELKKKFRKDVYEIYQRIENQVRQFDVLRYNLLIRLDTFFEPKENLMAKIYKDANEIYHYKKSSTRFGYTSFMRLQSYGYDLYNGNMTSINEKAWKREIEKWKKQVNDFINSLMRIEQYLTIKVERSTKERKTNERKINIEKYQKKLQNNDIDSLFEELLSDLRNNKPLFNQVTMLFARWNQMNMESRIGIVSYNEKNIESNKIKNGLLEIVQSIR